MQNRERLGSRLGFIMLSAGCAIGCGNVWKFPWMCGQNGVDPEKRTGVVLAKSIPAKNHGVKTGEPIGMALRKCPELVLAKPDFRLYEQCSKAFMDICREYAPVVEKYHEAKAREHDNPVVNKRFIHFEFEN